MKNLLLFLLILISVACEAQIRKGMFIHPDTGYFKLDTTKSSYAAMFILPNKTPRDLFTVYDKELGTVMMIEDDTCMTVIDSAATIRILVQCIRREYDMKKKWNK